MKVWNKRFVQSLKQYIEIELQDYRKMYGIIFCVMLGIAGLSITLMILMSRHIDTIHISGSSGLLNFGFVTITITLFVDAILRATRNEVARRMIFPISRKVYAAGNFLLLITNALVLLTVTSVVGVLELMFTRVLGSKASGVVISSGITLENFLLGFWICFCYILLMYSFTYFTGVWLARYKVYVLSSIIGLAILFVLLAPVQNTAAEAYEFLFLESSATVLSIKLLLLTGLFQAAAYIPLRRMEVTI